MKYILAPSILDANLSNITSLTSQLNSFGIEWLHLDVMDGHFVPNLTFGPVLVRAFRDTDTKLFLDVHLMIRNPDLLYPAFLDAGADLLTFHYESCPDKIDNLIQGTKSRRRKVGLSLRPGTPVNKIIPYLPQCDLVLIMTVEPGFGGQQFRVDVVPKITELRKIIDQYQYPCDIQVDGGINSATIGTAKNAGANVFVIGQTLFRSPDIKECIKLLTQQIM